MGQNDHAEISKAPSRVGDSDSRGNCATLGGSGSRVDLDLLFNAYRPYLKRVAVQELPRYLDRRLDASDLTQETLGRAAAQIQQFSGTTGAEFFCWLKQILQNLIVDLVRHNTCGKRDIRREHELCQAAVSPVASASTQLSNAEDLARVAAALQDFSDEQRQAIALRSQGMTFEEIGIHMTRTPDAARMMWGRAIARLVEIMKHNDRE